VTGTYDGDNTSDRVIFLGAAPKRVEVVWVDSTTHNWAISGITTGAADGQYGTTTIEATTGWITTVLKTKRPQLETTGFSVSGSAANQLNKTTITYTYIAYF